MGERSDYHADYYRRNAEAIKRRRRARYYADPDRLAKNRSSYQRNRDKILARARVHYQRHRAR
jgi:hypothetical protein